MKVSLIYHFFADYRQAVIDALIQGEDEYEFLANKSGLTAGLNVADIPESQFKECPAIVLPKGGLIQPSLIWHALTADSDAYIFLGDSKFITTWIASLCARMRGKRVLFWTHGWVREPRGISGLIKKAFYKLSHGLLLYGERARKIGLRNGFGSEALYVLNNSLDYAEMRRCAELVSREDLVKAKSELFNDECEHILFCSGRLTAPKRLDYIISAAAKLRADGMSVAVLLVGDGPERTALESLASELEVPVHFTGACFDPEKIAVYTSLAALTVCPEAAGLSVMQSMALGTPVVTNDSEETQMPESEAVIDGRTGGVYRTGDVGDLARVIQGLLVKTPTEQLLMSRVSSELMDELFSAAYQCEVMASAVRAENPEVRSVKTVVESLWNKE